MDYSGALVWIQASPCHHPNEVDTVIAPDISHFIKGWSEVGQMNYLGRNGSPMGIWRFCIEGTGKQFILIFFRLWLRACSWWGADGGGYGVRVLISFVGADCHKSPARVVSWCCWVVNYAVRWRIGWGEYWRAFSLWICGGNVGKIKSAKYNDI